MSVRGSPGRVSCELAELQSPRNLLRRRPVEGADNGGRRDELRELWGTCVRKADVGKDRERTGLSVGLFENEPLRFAERLRTPVVLYKAEF